jgi:hypothetical protein
VLERVEGISETLVLDPGSEYIGWGRTQSLGQPRKPVSSSLLLVTAGV